MAELGSGNGTGYPGALDTDSTQEVNSPNAGKTKARAEVINDLNAAVVAIQTELGTDPAGSKTDVKTFLQTEHAADGTHSTITASGSITTDANIATKSGTANTVTLDHAATGDHTLTLPDATDTLVGKATTDTLTNKTLTTPTIGDFTNATHDHADNAGGGNTLSVPTIADFTNAQHDHTDAANGGEVSSIGADSIGESHIDWANAGAIGQMQVTYSADIGSGTYSDLTAGTLYLYIPSNASTLEYYAYMDNDTGGAAVTYLELYIGATVGSEISVNTTSKSWSGLGTLDISAESGWTEISVQGKRLTDAGSIYRLALRFK